jgi:hypothetical protein
MAGKDRYSLLLHCIVSQRTSQRQLYEEAVQ